eukprot:jgi/Tetstr1/466427/TSEL_010955.t1
MESWHNVAKDAFPKVLRNPTDALMEKHFPMWMKDETYNRSSKQINPAFGMGRSTDAYFVVDYMQTPGSHLEVDGAPYLVGDPFKMGTRTVARSTSGVEAPQQLGRNSRKQSGMDTSCESAKISLP